MNWRRVWAIFTRTHPVSQDQVPMRVRKIGFGPIRYKRLQARYSEITAEIAKMHQQDGDQ